MKMLIFIIQKNRPRIGGLKKPRSEAWFICSGYIIGEVFIINTITYRRVEKLILKAYTNNNTPYFKNNIYKL